MEVACIGTISPHPQPSPKGEGAKMQKNRLVIFKVLSFQII